MQTTSHPPRTTFFLLLAAGIAGVMGAYAAAVLLAATEQALAALNQIFPFYHWQIRPVRIDTVHGLGWALALASALAGLGGVLVTLTKAGQLERAAFRAEYQRKPASYRESWARLGQGQKRTALLCLVAVTLLRLGLSIPAVTPPYDDGASYSLFVSRGLLAVAAYYPLPNNHVLANLLAWLFFQGGASFWWSIRLPVLLVATGATVLWYRGWLREKYSARAALLATGLASLSQLGLYHGATGRGYWLVAGCAALVFFAGQSLGRDTNRPRRAWLALVAGGIAGCWAVPTFALVLGSAVGWLGGHWWRHRRWPLLGSLAGAVGLIGLGSGLAYAPLLLVSGLDKLAGNGFVAARPLGTIVRGLPSYWWETEGFLAGQMRLGAVLVVLVLLGATLLLGSRRLRRMPMAAAAPWRRTGWAALWYIGFPYVLLLVQRVQAPGRTLFYKAFFLYALLALGTDWLLAQNRLPRRGGLRAMLGLAGGLWFGYQLWCHARDNSAPRRNNAAFRAAAAWLSRQPPGAALVPEPTHKIYLSLYLRSEHAAWPWQPDAQPRPGSAYPYVVCFPHQRGYFQPRLAATPAFQNSEVAIYRLDTTSAATPRPARYWFLAN